MQLSIKKEMPQSQTVDQPMAPRKRKQTTQRQQKRQFQKSNQLSLPNQDDCKTRKETKNYVTKHEPLHLIGA